MWLRQVKCDEDIQVKCDVRHPSKMWLKTYK